MEVQKKSHALPAAKLYRATDPTLCDPAEAAGEPDLALGQGRAVEAVQFGVGMRAKGYHLFLLGPR